LLLDQQVKVGVFSAVRWEQDFFSLTSHEKSKLFSGFSTFQESMARRDSLFDLLIEQQNNFLGRFNLFDVMIYELVLRNLVVVLSLFFLCCYFSLSTFHL